MVVEATGFEAGEPATAFICQARAGWEVGVVDTTADSASPSAWWGRLNRRPVLPLKGECCTSVSPHLIHLPITAELHVSSAYHLASQGEGDTGAAAHRRSQAHPACRAASLSCVPSRPLLLPLTWWYASQCKEPGINGLIL